MHSPMSVRRCPSTSTHHQHYRPSGGQPSRCPPLPALHGLPACSASACSGECKKQLVMDTSRQSRGPNPPWDGSRRASISGCVPGPSFPASEGPVQDFSGSVASDGAAQDYLVIIQRLLPSPEAIHRYSYIIYTSVPIPILWRFAVCVSSSTSVLGPPYPTSPSPSPFLPWRPSLLHSLEPSYTASLDWVKNVVQTSLPLSSRPNGIGPPCRGLPPVSRDS